MLFCGCTFGCGIAGGAITWLSRLALLLPNPAIEGLGTRELPDDVGREIGGASDGRLEALDDDEWKEMLGMTAGASLGGACWTAAK